MESQKSILNKLRVLTVVPSTIIVALFLLFLLQTYKDIDGLHNLSFSIAKIKKSAAFINELQKERGISSGYIGSKGKIFQDSLEIQRLQTDKAFLAFLELNIKERADLQQKQFILFEMRKKIDMLNLSMFNSFNGYTALISQMQNNFLNISTMIKDIYVKDTLQAFINLSLMKESLAELRGGFSGVFSQQKYTDHLHYITTYAKGTYDISEKNFNAIATPKFKHLYQDIIQTAQYNHLKNIVKNYTMDKGSGRLFENPKEWYDESTYIINQFFMIETKYISSIDEYTQLKYHQEIINSLIIFFLFVIFIILSIWLSLKIKRNIKSNIKLLHEYKSAVDRSSIVSKTDKQGRLTYVNKEFCAISGYSKEELIGKPHNIVRHPEMSKEAFTDMWATILSKKSWSGIVTNRKKDGTSYTVEATISPILNSDGEIEEFIAIRNDITDILKLHKEIEHTQSDLIFRMGEIGETRSKETGHHVKRVARYSQLLAQYYGMSEQEIKYLVAASPMHDIGKVGISDSILNKNGKLTKIEWNVMKTHATIGYDLFRDSEKPLLRTAAIIAYQHHEKYDGSGYPRGLSGENIHIYGRITAVADVFDALGSDRCYKKAWDDDKIFTLLKEERGKHFDPQLIDIFFDHLDEFLEIRDYFSDQSSAMRSE